MCYSIVYHLILMKQRGNQRSHVCWQLGLVNCELVLHAMNYARNSRYRWQTEVTVTLAKYLSSHAADRPTARITYADPPRRLMPITHVAEIGAENCYRFSAPISATCVIGITLGLLRRLIMRHRSCWYGHVCQSNEDRPVCVFALFTLMGHSPPQ